MKFTANLASPPLGAVLTSKLIPNRGISLEWGKETVLQVSPTLSLDSTAGISRYLARLSPELQLHGEDALQRTEVDHWLGFSLGPLACNQEFQDALKYLDNALAPITYLVGTKLTIADLNVFSALLLNQNWIKLVETSASSHLPNVKRWFKFVNNISGVKATLAELPEEVLGKTKKEVRSSEPKEEGKFVDLSGAEMGKVVVRFPPEASGFLHIGHAKAALLNWHYKELFNGTLIMRFDDTNPDKEKVAFEKVILEDLKLLEIYPDKFTHTSQYFPMLLELCEGLLRSGKAYVDDTPPEQMKAEREQRQPSRNRDNAVDRNFSMWAEMLQGSDFGQRCCVRAKIDMASDNGCMRDPTIYRCKNEPHPRTGTQYKVYPTYDFACPVVDSVEGVTHALRTMEYHDRDDQFYWFIDALKLRKPYIWEYSRLNMMNTVLSKRKLTWFVDEGLVESWEDPRFPTVRGVLRRGMTVQGLKQFIIAQGSSRSVVQMEWDKIWAFNKKVIDPVAPRYTALEAGSTVVVNVRGAKPGTLTVPKHPKNSEVGTKTVAVGPRVLIAAEDAALLKEGENATFINWGNLTISRLQRGGSERVTGVDAELNLSNTDFKKTLKLTWLAEVAGLTPIQVLFYDHIITKPVLGKDEDFKLYINKESKKSVQYIGDPELGSLKTGDIIQLQRIGFFRVDAPASPGKPVVLIHIPDGSTKSPTIASDERKPASAKQTEDLGPALTNAELEDIAVKWREDYAKQSSAPAPVVNGTASGSLTDRINDQGNKVRQLKADKASKGDVDAAVKQLLALKQEYKAATGQEWKPGCGPAPVVQAATAPASAASGSVSDRITEQGNKVRQLKADKASKADVDVAVKELLALKKEYQAATGQEWKPGVTAAPVPVVAPVVTAAPVSGSVSARITEQGNKVRQLKSDKASKAEIDAAVKELLALKQEYKASTGQEWKPGVASAPVAIAKSTVAIAPVSGNVSDRITEQGNKVRQLKAEKARKPEIDAAVKQLLSLKQEYKATTGQDWTPGAAPVVVAASPPSLTAPAAAVSPPGVSPPAGGITDQITEQGNNVRQLKADKASKADIDVAVKQLLALKKEYQAATGEEWTPGAAPVSAPPAPALASAMPSTADQISAKIAEQGNQVRQLKADKAGKADVDAAVKLLLSLKQEYKAASGQEWKPPTTSAPAPAAVAAATRQAPAVAPAPAGDLSSQITEQANKVRQLKSQKASKAEIDIAVQALLTLKQNYKNSTGQEWQPTATPVPFAPAGQGSDLSAQITAQGDKVRELKAAKADKAAVDAAVKALLALKAEFKNSTGQEWKPNTAAAQGAPTAQARSPPKKPAEKKQKPEKKDKEKSVEKDDDKGLKKQTRLGLEARKEDNLADWYSQVITKGELIEYYDVSGCYILRPWAFAVWESIQQFLDKEIKKLGVVNAYFPMFVSRSVLEREKAHIEDFAPEVAWVTRSGDSELAEHIAIRPTSETAMYPAYSKWIQSHRDLPLRLNQWNNVVRWEFKQPQPFLRTREFLWQEGHTAFATYKEAEEEVYQILDLYARVYTDLLAVPVVKGRKTEKEKFAGGDYTTTVEAFVSASGRGIQGATSHHLGHNFAKMFDITVEDPESKEKMFVYQNSWGLTTRTIGVMIMVHADNQGLVMPPAVSALQVVIVPCGITASLSEPARLELINTCKQLDGDLRSVDIRSKLDERDNYSPGWKFNHWELKGVPLRVELGPKDLEKKQLVAVRRDTGQKLTVQLPGAAAAISEILNTIQASLLAAAEADLKAHTKIVTRWTEFCSTLDAKNIILSPFCEGVGCEENIKKDSVRDQELEPGAPAMGAKSLCIPFEQPAAINPGDRCIHPACSAPAKSYTLFGRSY